MLLSFTSLTSSSGGSGGSELGGEKKGFIVQISKTGIVITTGSMINGTFSLPKNNKHNLIQRVKG